MTVALLLVLLALVAAYTAAASNRFARQRHLVAESWAQVEVELRRRRDLVPALVDTVRAYEQHESGVLRELVAAREQAVLASGPGEVEPAEERLSRALSALPSLPALQTGPVQQLQAQLAETEDRIAAARRFHAANVRALDVRLDTFPSSLVARALGVERPDDAGPGPYGSALTDRERAELELPPER